MFPQLFHLGHFALPTYGFLVALGVLTGLIVTTKLAPSQKINPDDAWNLGVLVVLAAIIGAKLLLIINDFGWYTSHPREIFSLSMVQAGGVFYGGVIAALVTAAFYMRKHHMPALRTCDTFAPGLALGHSIGRIGCFAAGCCFGKPTNHWWGVVFTNPLSQAPLNVRLEPTELFEAAIELINFFILYWLFQRKKFEGQIIGSYLLQRTGVASDGRTDSAYNDRITRFHFSCTTHRGICNLSFLCLRRVFYAIYYKPKIRSAFR